MGWVQSGLPPSPGSGPDWAANAGKEPVDGGCVADVSQELPAPASGDVAPVEAFSAGVQGRDAPPPAGPRPPRRGRGGHRKASPRSAEGQATPGVRAPNGGPGPAPPADSRCGRHGYRRRPATPPGPAAKSRASRPADPGARFSAGFSRAARVRPVSAARSTGRSEIFDGGSSSGRRPPGRSRASDVAQFQDGVSRSRTPYGSVGTGQRRIAFQAQQGVDRAAGQQPAGVPEPYLGSGVKHQDQAGQRSLRRDATAAWRRRCGQ